VNRKTMSTMRCWNSPSSLGYASVAHFPIILRISQRIHYGKIGHLELDDTRNGGCSRASAACSAARSKSKLSDHASVDTLSESVSLSNCSYFAQRPSHVRHRAKHPPKFIISSRMCCFSKSCALLTRCTFQIRLFQTPLTASRLLGDVAKGQ
jgi:hypothetical protein